MMYSFEFIKNNWVFNKYWVNCLAVSDKNANINNILVNLFSFISEYKRKDEYNNLYAVNEDALFKLISKLKKKDPISAAEYVANKVRYTNKAMSDESFYDKSTIIDIIDESGNMHQGIIRISNHDVDMQKWAEQNSGYDFGISFVFDDITHEWHGNDIVANYERSICIYEYDFTVKGTNREFLDVIIAQILNIKKSGKFNYNTNVKGVLPNKRISQIQEKLLNAIEKALKFLND